MKNNKLTRKREERLARKQSQQVAAELPDGTQVLKSKESRAKLRRWSFEADMELQVLSNAPVISRVVKLEVVSYSNAREAREDCKRREQNLRATNPVFAKAKITVRAIPHETISNLTMRQLSGYRDMAMILDKALSLAIEEAEQVVLGKSVGSQFVTKAAEVDEKGQDVTPAFTTSSIKEDFYKRALATFGDANAQKDGMLPILNPEGTQVTAGESGTGSEGDSSEPEPFVPEIVEIQRASPVECQTT